MDLAKWYESTPLLDFENTTQQWVIVIGQPNKNGPDAGECEKAAGGRQSTQHTLRVVARLCVED
jgi:hypothetical protein